MTKPQALRRFLKLNQFKVILFAAYILVTLLAFLAAEKTKDDGIATAFVVLSYPALALAWNLQFLPIFRTCHPQAGYEGDFCAYDQTIPLILGLLAFILYAWCLASAVEWLAHRKRGTGTQDGVKIP
jgi:hypothetical protein